MVIVFSGVDVKPGYSMITQLNEKKFYGTHIIGFTCFHNITNRLRLKRNYQAFEKYS